MCVDLPTTTTTTTTLPAVGVTKDIIHQPADFHSWILQRLESIEAGVGGEEGCQGLQNTHLQGVLGYAYVAFVIYISRLEMGYREMG